MNEYEKQLFEKGYVKLQLGSYRMWISKRWHEFFCYQGFVRKNFYGQFVSNTKSLKEFIRWLELYDKAMHDRDYPKSYSQLSEEERALIKQTLGTN